MEVTNGAIRDPLGRFQRYSSVSDLRLPTVEYPIDPTLYTPRYPIGQCLRCYSVSDWTIPEIRYYIRLDIAYCSVSDWTLATVLSGIPFELHYDAYRTDVNYGAIRFVS